ncbi:MAG: hypothetical protein AAFZ18_28355 [Myxococcota bacterium]
MTSKDRGAQTSLPRRSFLGAVTAGSAVACATVPAAPRRMSSRELDDILARLDRSTAMIDRSELDGIFEAQLPRSGTHAAYRAEVGPMVRRTMKTLVVTGGLGEVAHQPEVPDVFRSRARSLGPEMAHSVAENLTLLRSLNPRGRRRIAQTLRDRPELPLTLAGEMDQISGRIGVAPSTRLKLRRIASRVSSTLPRQAAGGYLEEVSHQMTKFMTYRGVDMQAVERMAASSQRTVIANLDRASPPPSSGAVRPVEVEPRSEEELTQEAQRERGATTMKVGGGLIAGALGALGLGALLSVATGNPWPVLIGGITIGGILLVAGLVVVIVGATIRASA